MHRPESEIKVKVTVSDRGVCVYTATIITIIEARRRWWWKKGAYRMYVKSMPIHESKAVVLVMEDNQ